MALHGRTLANNKQTADIVAVFQIHFLLLTIISYLKIHKLHRLWEISLQNRTIKVNEL